MKIVKHEGYLMWIEKRYEIPDLGNRMPKYIFKEELIAFLDAQNIVLDPYQPYPEVIEFADVENNIVTVRCKLYGRYKTEDEKYSDCVEFMIENLT